MDCPRTVQYVIKIEILVKYKIRVSSYYKCNLIFLTIRRLSYGLSEDKSEENPRITITITNTIYI